MEMKMKMKMKMIVKNKYMSSRLTFYIQKV
jgi:hypothetical protein